MFQKKNEWNKSKKKSSKGRKIQGKFATIITITTNLDLDQKNPKSWYFWAIYTLYNKVFLYREKKTNSCHYQQQRNNNKKKSVYPIQQTDRNSKLSNNVTKMSNKIVILWKKNFCFFGFFFCHNLIAILLCVFNQITCNVIINWIDWPTKLIDRSIDYK